MLFVTEENQTDLNKMSKLQQVTQKDRFYHELLLMRKQLDRLIADYAATLKPARRHKPFSEVLIDSAHRMPLGREGEKGEEK